MGVGIAGRVVETKKPMIVIVILRRFLDIIAYYPFRVFCGFFGKISNYN